MALERKKPRGRLSFPGHPAGFTVRPLRETPHGNLRLWMRAVAVTGQWTGGPPSKAPPSVQALSSWQTPRLCWAFFEAKGAAAPSSSCWLPHSETRHCSVEEQPGKRRAGAKSAFVSCRSAPLLSPFTFPAPGKWGGHRHDAVPEPLRAFIKRLRHTTAWHACRVGLGFRAGDPGTEEAAALPLGPSP